MSDQPTNRPTRPELGQPRTKPRPAVVTGDPADPVTPAPVAPGADVATSALASPGAGKSTRRMVPISTAEPTIAVQYRLTDRERDILLRMQEARGDRRGIDTMRWFLATYGEEAIAAASRG